ncbi:hypothetical protein AVEN_255130-1 [Araneus ventricosus]|uniref:Uncharacterized protein n=1 Tax=Araneus ventricosus TaxID=182803 RepID=A0A4Y2BB07_ARAVE|nr:hypothetical protein AVEN_255130-1 [Araneus ventricosus]
MVPRKRHPQSSTPIEVNKLSDTQLLLKSEAKQNLLQSAYVWGPRIPTQQTENIPDSESTSSSQRLADASKFNVTNYYTSNFFTNSARTSRENLDNSHHYMEVKSSDTKLPPNLTTNNRQGLIQISKKSKIFPQEPARTDNQMHTDSEFYRTQQAEKAVEICLKIERIRAEEIPAWKI